LGPEEGEDVVQEAFERGIRDEGFFEKVSQPVAWLRAVTIRLAISRLRRRAVWERIRLRLPQAADGMPDPDLHDALRRLSPTHRGALVLRYFFGADYSEIAQATGLSQNSVGQILSRARAALRRELK
jgi:RNA polymerase sigma-70 factor (ECF subfamily)